MDQGEELQSQPSEGHNAALARFLAALRADEALQARLAPLREPAAFAAATVEAAGALGFTLDSLSLAASLTPDPLDLGRFDGSPPTSAIWPPRAWLPTAVVPAGAQWAVEWKHFAGARLSEPFFLETVRRVQDLPINRLLRWRVSLDDFVANAPTAGTPPRGFIFHMSRCGSTLVAQMIAAMEQAIMISEAPPLDAIVNLAMDEANATPAARDALMRAMVLALGRGCGPGVDYVIKLDSWHSAALPLFRRVFPQTPWVFLYRDPVEVLASQTRLRGAQTLPQIVDNAFQIDGLDMDSEEFCARVLARSCEDAVAHHALGGGLIVDYASLPAAVEARILPHFGIVPDAAARAAMTAASQRNAKRPSETFVADSVEKRAEASPKLKALAARFFDEPVRQLAALRAGGA